MSIQSEIDRLKQVVSDAFTAIGNKGGTVPTSQVSGNLASAIASIPAGVTVQTKSGSFTTSTKGVFSVTCGFRPDVVFVHRSETEDSQKYVTAFPFALYSAGTAMSVPLWTTSSSCNVYDFYGVINTSTGFSGEAYTWDDNWEEGYANRVSFNYVAIKYTA